MKPPGADSAGISRDDLGERTSRYIEKLNPAIFGEKKQLRVTNIQHIGAGTRHFNFLATINGRRYNVRFSLTDHPKAHIEYEYGALMALKDTGFAPRAFYYELNGSSLGLPFLILEYIDGKHPDFNDKTVTELAKKIAEIHKTKLNGDAAKALRLKVTKEQILSVIKVKVDYLTKKMQQYNGPATFGNTLNGGYKKIDSLQVDETRGGVISHGDVAFHNIVITNAGLMLIDWETVTISDPGYDVAALFNRTGFDDAHKERFIEVYLSNIHDNDFRRRLEVFEKFRTFDRFCWLLWEAFDVQEGAKGGYFPEWRSADLYLKQAKEKMQQCKDLGILPKELKWDELGIEEMFGKADKRIKGIVRTW